MASTCQRCPRSVVPPLASVRLRMHVRDQRIDRPSPLASNLRGWIPPTLPPNAVGDCFLFRLPLGSSRQQLRSSPPALVRGQDPPGKERHRPPHALTRRFLLRWSPRRSHGGRTPRVALKGIRACVPALGLPCPWPWPWPRPWPLPRCEDEVKPASRLARFCLPSRDTRRR